MSQVSQASAREGPKSQLVLPRGLSTFSRLGKIVCKARPPEYLALTMSLMALPMWRVNGRHKAAAISQLERINGLDNLL